MPRTAGFVGGNVLTMGEVQNGSALFIEDGLVALVGRDEDVLACCAKAGVQAIDLKGRTAVPGLHDCHVHMMGTGLNAQAIDLYDCKSVADVLDKLKAADAVIPEDRWIFGKRLDESRLAEGCPPSMAELDSALSRRNVYIIDRGWHYTLVNRRAFDSLGIDRSMAGVCVNADGVLNGRLHEDANATAKHAFFELQSIDARREAFRYTSEYAAAKGVTTIHAMEGGSLFVDSDIRILLSMNDLPTHVTLYWPAAGVEDIKEKKLKQWGGDILLDGSIGSRTAAFPEPYSDDPGNCGKLYYNEEQITSWIVDAHKNDVQIAFHAIGQSAVTQALDCLEAALKRYPVTDHRMRIEHFGFPTRGDILRAAKLGAVISTQPSFTYLRGGPGTVYNQRLGTKRERAAYPLRAFLDAGITVGGGSDSDVTPIDPLLGIHAAVNPPYGENGVTALEALKMFTIWAAAIAKEEKEKGSLEPGKLGDVTILEKNPLEVEPTLIKDIGVWMTVKAGEITYSK